LVSFGDEWDLPIVMGRKNACHAPNCCTGIATDVVVRALGPARGREVPVALRAPSKYDGRQNWLVRKKFQKIFKKTLKFLAAHP
jgi:hypothetical protein